MMRKWIFLLILMFIFGDIVAQEFESPTAREINFATIEQIKYNLRGKGVGLEYKDQFDKLVAEEEIGFLGYYGDGLDFLIFQDIVRITVEEIVGIPIRKDFHFLSIPCHKMCSSLEALSQQFVKDHYQEQFVAENTFPLNFTLYSNHNRCGLNSVVNFTKNTNDTSMKHRQELMYFFEQLGIDSSIVEMLYENAYRHLITKTGVIIRLFDNSTPSYAFGNAFSYASYPNGFITENRLISEYFLDNSSREFPQELRFTLTLEGILNPNAPLSIKRFTKIQPSKLKAWEDEARNLIKTLSYNCEKCNELKAALQKAWN